MVITSYYTLNLHDVIFQLYQQSWKKKIPTETEHGNLTTKSISLQSDNVANNTPAAYYKKKSHYALTSSHKTCHILTHIKHMIINFKPII